MYKRLAVLFHPDRSGRIDGRSAERAMRVLTRTMELVSAKMKFDNVSRVRSNKEKYNVCDGLIFHAEETDLEYIMRSRRTGAECAQESRNKERQLRTSAPQQASSAAQHLTAVEHENCDKDEKRTS